MSKRKLLQLVKENHVSGWDDPRMPTLSGIRRRGYPPEAIKLFAQRIGVSKAESVIEYDTLENCAREYLDQTAHRAMAVIAPLKVIIKNYPQNKNEVLHSQVHPKIAELGKRELPFGREIFIEAKDFMENPHSDFFRLKPGGEVRLRNAYVIKCEEVIKDPSGKILELHCTYDPVTLGGKPPADGRKIKGIIHWVSAEKSITAEVRLYGRLFSTADPENVGPNESFVKNLNPDSLVVKKNARLEIGLQSANMQNRYQFERVGYFCLDSKDTKPDALVFNQIVSLETAK
jgi:glutaminyl-tRNA synthetase